MKNKRMILVVALCLIFIMALPMNCFAAATEVSPADVPTFMTTLETNDLTVADISLGDELLLTSNGNSGILEGTINIQNNRDVGTLTVTKIKFTDQPVLTGWDMVPDTTNLKALPINTRSYSLTVKKNATQYADLKQVVEPAEEAITIEPNDDMDLEFKGKVTAVSSSWTRVPLGKVTLSFKLVQYDPMYQIQMAEVNGVKLVPSINRLYASDEEEIQVVITNTSGNTITGMKVTNKDTNAQIAVDTDTPGQKYSYEMPAAPVYVEPLFD